MVLDDFGLLEPGEKLAKVDLVRRLNHFAISQMAAGGNVVIMLDEAQNLTTRAIEGLRLISNLESEERKLIQIVISGQTELNEKLAATEHRQFKQRITLKRALTPLTQEQAQQYLQHRLTVARYSGPPIFPPKTLKLIHEYSGGVPRLINSICENALVSAYALDKKTVEPYVIEEIARDLGLSKIAGNGHRRFSLFRKKRAEG
jgi:general secretion pathway protein A